MYMIYIYVCVCVCVGVYLWLVTISRLIPRVTEPILKFLGHTKNTKNLKNQLSSMALSQNRPSLKALKAAAYDTSRRELQ